MSLFSQIVAQKLVRHIENKLLQCINSLPPKVQINLPTIHVGGRPTLYFDSDANGETYHGRRPSGCFITEGQAFPNVVVQISHTRARVEKLDETAHDYILGSNGAIALMVGLDVRDNIPTAHLWRLCKVVAEDGIVDCMVERSAWPGNIRNSDQTPVEGAQLSLSLSEFLPPNTLAAKNDRVIQVPFRFLSQTIHEAKSISTIKSGSCFATIQPGERKRKRVALLGDNVSSRQREEEESDDNEPLAASGRDCIRRTHNLNDDQPVAECVRDWIRRTHNLNDDESVADSVGDWIRRRPNLNNLL